MLAPPLSMVFAGTYSYRTKRRLLLYMKSITFRGRIRKLTKQAAAVWFMCMALDPEAAEWRQITLICKRWIRHTPISPSPLNYLSISTGPSPSKLKRERPHTRFRKTAKLIWKTESGYSDGNIKADNARGVRTSYPHTNRNHRLVWTNTSFIYPTTTSSADTNMYCNGQIVR